MTINTLFSGLFVILSSGDGQKSSDILFIFEQLKGLFNELERQVIQIFFLYQLSVLQLIEISLNEYVLSVDVII